MTNCEKFRADIERIKKHTRAQNGGSYNYKKACSDIMQLFERNNSRFISLPHSLSDFWFNTYIEQSAEVINEPTPENTDKLCAIQAFLDNEDDYSCLTSDDWKEIAKLVNYEAEDLDISDLTNLMKIIVSKQAL